MSELICPFGVTLVKKDFGCKNAREIVRRGGAEIACEHSDAHGICSGLHNTVKTSALRAMDLDDDLSTLPHSVSVKIQYGALLGLQALTATSARQGNRVADISSLIATAMGEFHSLNNIPVESINKTIIDYTTQRRRKKYKKP